MHQVEGWNFKCKRFSSKMLAIIRRCHLEPHVHPPTAKY